MLEGKAAVQRHLDRYEEWTDSNIMKFKPSVKSCIREGITACNTMGWGLAGYKAA